LSPTWTKIRTHCLFQETCFIVYEQQWVVVVQDRLLLRL